MDAFKELDEKRGERERRREGELLQAELQGRKLQAELQPNVAAYAPRKEDANERIKRMAARRHPGLLPHKWQWLGCATTMEWQGPCQEHWGERDGALHRLWLCRTRVALPTKILNVGSKGWPTRPVLQVHIAGVKHTHTDIYIYVYSDVVNKLQRT